MTPAISQFPITQRVKAVIYLLVLLSSAAFAKMQQDISMFLLTGIVCLIAWLVVEGRGLGGKGKAVPKIFVNASIAVAALYLWYQISDSARDRNLILCLGQFVVALMICKLLERKTPRDLVQLVILSLVVIVASTMFSASIVFALILLVYFALLVYSIVLLNLYTESIAAGTADRSLLLTVRHEEIPRFIRDIRRVATHSALLLIPVAMLFFLCMPRGRNTGSFLAKWGANGVYQTGFSENVQFHDYGQLNESDTVTMEVRLKENGQEKGSELYEPYFRGRVLDAYDPSRKTWYHAGINDPVTTFSERLNLLPEDGDMPARVLTQEYTLYPPSNRFLFSVAPQVGFSSDLANVNYNPITHTFSLNGGSTRKLWYSVTSIVRNDSLLYAPADMEKSLPNPRRTGGVSFPPGQEVPLNLRLPADVLKDVRGLAMDIAKNALPPAERDLQSDDVQRVVEQIEFYLRSHYPYSLDFRQVDPTLDPTVDFLMHRQSTGGHCEYFASAMVMLCRSLGIPARMVTGYKGGDYNSVGGYYVVRQKHAHAWAEILVPDVGWVESDPSPASNNFDPTTSFIKQWMGEVSQFMQNVWMGTVIGFDNDSRTLLMARLSASVQHYLAPFVEFAATVKYLATAPSLDVSIRLSFFLSALGLLVMFAWLGRRWYLERRIARQIVAYRRGVKLSPETLFLDDLLKLLVRKDGRLRGGRNPDQTPREFVEQAAPSLGAAQQDARWLVQTFYAMQFGGVRATGEIRGEIAQAMGRVREALRGLHGKSDAAAQG